jgi:phospholipase/carboxylesterase
MEPRLPRNAGPVQWAGPEDKNCVKSGLIHCVRLPATIAENGLVPAVVMLHGWAGDESSMWIFKQVIPAEAAAVTPRAPLELNENEFAWYRHGASRTRPEPELLAEGLVYLDQFLTGLPDLYPIDPARLLLLGFSQGAAIGNGLALTRPDRIIGMASLAGILPELPEADIQKAKLAGLPVFIAHGRQDTIIPISAAQRSRDAYRELGAEVTYEEYETGHKMSVEGIRHLKQWVAGVFERHRA